MIKSVLALLILFLTVTTVYSRESSDAERRLEEDIHELSHQSQNCGLVFYVLSVNVSHITDEQKSKYKYLFELFTEVSIALVPNEEIRKARTQLWANDYKKKYMPNGELYMGWLSIFTNEQVEPCVVLFNDLPNKLNSLKIRMKNAK